MRVLAPAEVDSSGVMEEYEATYSIMWYRNPLVRLGGLARRIGSALGLGLFAHLSEIPRPDVINLHFTFPCGLPLLLARRILWPRVPIVLSLVGRSDVYRHQSVLRRLYMRFVISGCDALIPNSGFYLSGSPWESDSRSEIIPYGVSEEFVASADAAREARKGSGPADSRVMLLTVQRLVPVKRVDLVIRAFEVLHRSVPTSELVIVGAGPEERALRHLVERLGIVDAVSFAGYVADHDLPVLFGSADLFVFASASETFGVVLAQAMATGLPIVATGSSCIPWVVEDGVNGRVVRSCQPEALADAAAALLTDAHLKNEIIESNRARSVEFDWGMISNRYERTLEAAAVQP